MTETQAEILRYLAEGARLHSSYRGISYWLTYNEGRTMRPVDLIDVGYLVNNGYLSYQAGGQSDGEGVFLLADKAVDNPANANP